MFKTTLVLLLLAVYIAAQYNSLYFDQEMESYDVFNEEDDAESLDHIKQFDVDKACKHQGFERGYFESEKKNRIVCISDKSYFKSIQVMCKDYFPSSTSATRDRYCVSPPPKQTSLNIVAYCHNLGYDDAWIVRQSQWYCVRGSRPMLQLTENHITQACIFSTKSQNAVAKTSDRSNPKAWYCDNVAGLQPIYQKLDGKEYCISQGFQSGYDSHSDDDVIGAVCEKQTKTFWSDDLCDAEWGTRSINNNHNYAVRYGSGIGCQEINEGWNPRSHADLSH